MKTLIIIAVASSAVALAAGLIILLRHARRNRSSSPSSTGRSTPHRDTGATRFGPEQQRDTVMGNSAAAVPAIAPPPPALLNRRLAKGQAFARHGQPENALTYFLWCYHAGSGVPEFSGLRRSALLRSWLELGQHFAPALEAARAERNQAEQRMLSPDGDEEAARDFAALNRYLKDTAKTLELYDGLPSGDPRRRELSSAVFDELVSARRYSEAVRAKPYELMHVVLEDALESAVASPGYLPSVLVRNVARSVEALAGAGELEQARHLADRVLSLDGSPQAWEILRRHAARAGRIDLLPPVAR